MNILDLPGETLLTMWKSSNYTQPQMAAVYGVDQDKLHSKINNAQQRAIRDVGREVLKPSPYPIYDAPLEMEGDAVVIPDPEFPFHNAPFINKVLDLADRWGVKQCIIAGDVLHFNSISKWEPSWKAKPEKGMPEEQEKTLLAYADKLPKREREKFISDVIGSEAGQDDVGSEVENARASLVRLGEQFDLVHYVIGNHDGRFLSALHSPMFAGKLLDFIGLNDPKWKIAPYYYSMLHSGGRRFRIEHPRGASQGTASNLASKFLCDILMGHSHSLSMQFDRSGRYYAIHMGCCVDERRLPYASQRSSAAPAHVPGAVIVRDGYPWLLTEFTPWDRL